MMQNVIAFPKKAVDRSAVVEKTGAMTLFVHIRQTTLIMHVAAQPVPAVAGNKISRR